MLLSGLASRGYAQARWTVNGTELAAVHANFHVHTLWSAGKGSDDHAQCETPQCVVARAATGGLQVIGYADHCSHLDPWEWGLLPWDAARLPQPGVDWRTLTILGNSGGDGGPGKCAAMAGFEWTPGADLWDLLNPRMRYRKIGHVNVFYPDLSAADVGDAGVARAHPILCGRKEAAGSMAMAREVPGAAVDCPELKTLYARLREQMKRGAAAPLAQFNHPVTKVGIGDPRRGVEVYPEHFSDFAFEPALSDCFVLFEVATLATHRYWVKGIVRCDMPDSEPMYQRALAKGWRLGPSIGVDNDDERLSVGPPTYTGLWLPGARFTVVDVATALRQRRVFGTEISGLTVALWTTDHDGKTVPMGSEAHVPASGRLQLQADLAMESADALPAFNYVRVVEVRSDGGSVALDVEPEGGHISVEVTPGPKTVCYYVRAACPPLRRGRERGLMSAPVWVKRP